MAGNTAQPIWGSTSQGIARSIELDAARQRAQAAVTLLITEHAPRLYVQFVGPRSRLEGPTIRQVPHAAREVARLLHATATPLVSLGNSLDPQTPYAVLSERSIRQAQQTFYRSGRHHEGGIERQRWNAHKRISGDPGEHPYIRLADAVLSLADAHTDARSVMVETSCADFLLYGPDAIAAIQLEAAESVAS